MCRPRLAGVVSPSTDLKDARHSHVTGGDWQVELFGTKATIGLGLLYVVLKGIRVSPNLGLGLAKNRLDTSNVVRKCLVL